MKEYAKWLHISENNGTVDEHKPLGTDSVIMNEFKNMYRPDMDVTLESVGSIDEILASMELLNLDKYGK